MISSANAILIATATCAFLSACGGSTGGSVTSAPPPPSSPTPSPSPIPTPSSPLEATQDFATVGIVTRESSEPDGSGLRIDPPSISEPIGFQYSAETRTYTISVPDFAPGTLVADPTTATTGHYKVATGTDISRLQRLWVSLNPQQRDGTDIALTYTGFGAWGGTVSESPRVNTSGGYFAYGIATPTSGIPVSGSAKYSARVAGTGFIYGWRAPISIRGNAELSFDFGRGLLSGFMDPTLMDDWGPTPLGRYTFVDTVHGVGNRTFSGLLMIDGSNAGSGFLGRFTGPNANELMASWFARFRDPYGSSTAWGTMSGVWVGKKD